MGLGGLMAEGSARPGWYLAPGGNRRWWDGQAWHDERTAPAAQWGAQETDTHLQDRSASAPTDAGPSGLAIASMIVGIVGIVVAVNAYSKPILFLGYADIFGPIVLGGVAVVLAALSGRRGAGFRVAGFICGGAAAAAGLLFIIAIAKR